MSYKEKSIHTAHPDYDVQFWNYMKGVPCVSDRLKKGYAQNTGTYNLPAKADKDYENEINKKSVFRNIASVFTSYDTPENIVTADSDDVAEFIQEGESISVKDISDDFSTIKIASNKLATILRLPTEFVSDALFNLKGYLIKRLAKSFARAEDNAFINGTGSDEPIGILHSTKGAETAASVSELTYDDVITLYFSVKPEYRNNGVWIMNDNTALALKKLKDESGNYLWNNADNTILGKPVLISEYMPDAEDTEKPIAFGDFSYYWIVKRKPVSIKVLEELFALRHQTGYLGFEFIDGKLIRSDAIKVIEISSEE